MAERNININISIAINNKLEKLSHQLITKKMSSSLNYNKFEHIKKKEAILNVCSKIPLLFLSSLLLVRFCFVRWHDKMLP